MELSQLNGLKYKLMLYHDPAIVIGQWIMSKLCIWGHEFV